jgi:hypothetical protein
MGHWARGAKRDRDMQRAQQHPDNSSSVGVTPRVMASIARCGGLQIDASQQGRVLAVLRCAVSGLVILGLTAGAAAPQPNFDCDKAYKTFWERLDREMYAKLPPEQLVVLSRKALRIYDACQTGDVEDAKGLFERLVRLTK